jgi:uncharacterized surface protein with fasciclin (FAS1) repeats
MKKHSRFFLIAITALILSCTNSDTKVTGSNDSAPAAGQSGVQDDESQKDVVKVAAGSKDHTTLVAAVKQAQLVDALSMQDHLQFSLQPMKHLTNCQKVLLKI